MKKHPPAVPHEWGLYEDLRKPGEAAGYLNAAILHGDTEAILLALYDIAKAHNLSRIAEKIKVNRPSLYKMLNKKGNPGFRNIINLIKALGISFQFTAPATHRRAA